MNGSDGRGGVKVGRYTIPVYTPSRVNVLLDAVIREDIADRRAGRREGCEIEQTCANDGVIGESRITKAN